MLEGYWFSCIEPIFENFEAFDGHDLRPFGVLPNLAITLEGNTVQVEAEIVDANLNYNLLLGRS